jgi:outer membrane protein assembly factor BamB
VITSEGYRPKAVLRALNLADGQVVFEQQVSGLVDSAPAVLDETLCFGAHDGRLHLLSTENGRPVDLVPLASKVYSSPAFSDGRVYVGANDGHLYCLE